MHTLVTHTVSRRRLLESIMSLLVVGALTAKADRLITSGTTMKALKTETSEVELGKLAAHYLSDAS
jgi:hypothetical protein